LTAVPLQREREREREGERDKRGVVGERRANKAKKESV
jgi:hypothetical protein